jgi:two-component system, OmpR family, response regulator
LRILVVTDNLDIAGAVGATLERQGFGVHVALDGDSGLDALLRTTYDAAVVDLVLPGRDGFAICLAARGQGIRTPVLILTAHDSVEVRARGRNAGADDYLVKPFFEEKLTGRLRALLHRGCLPVHAKIAAGELVIDQGGRTAAYRGRPVDLAPTEFRILEYLALNLNVVVSRKQIRERVWGDSLDGESNIVNVYVSAIRRKLGIAGGRNRIVTVWGIGYKFIG